MIESAEKQGMASFYMLDGPAYRKRCRLVDAKREKVAFFLEAAKRARA